MAPAAAARSVVGCVVADPQVVAHVLRAARVGGVAAGVARGAAAAPPPHPSRRAARDLLLHYDRVAKLAFRETAFLVYARGCHRSFNRLQAARRRLEVGPETFLELTVQ